MSSGYTHRGEVSWAYPPGDVFTLIDIGDYIVY